MIPGFIRLGFIFTRQFQEPTLRLFVPNQLCELTKVVCLAPKLIGIHCRRAVPARF